jgi:hypothetical protein
MKKIKIFMVASLFCLPIFIGCDIITQTKELPDIVGTWYCEETNIMYVFNSDSSGLWSFDTPLNITYIFNGDEIETKICTPDTCIQTDYPLIYNYNGTFTHPIGNHKFVLKRVEKNNIFGIWYNVEHDLYYVFNPDNTGKIQIVSNGLFRLISYTVSGNDVVIQDGSAICTYYGGDSFENNNGYVFVRQ